MTFYLKSVPQLKKGDAFVKLIDLISTLRDSVRGNLKDFAAVQTAIDAALKSIADASTGNGSNSEQTREAAVIATRFIEKL